MKEETGERLAFGITEFCRLHAISRGFSTNSKSKV
jgi:hypothetical protein